MDFRPTKKERAFRPWTNISNNWVSITRQHRWPRTKMKGLWLTETPTLGVDPHVSPWELQSLNNPTSKLLGPIQETCNIIDQICFGLECSTCSLKILMTFVGRLISSDLCCNSFTFAFHVSSPSINVLSIPYGFF